MAHPVCLNTRPVGLCEPAGLNPGPVNGKLDAAARRAIAQYARRKDAACAFQSGVLTENLLAALTAQEGAVKPND